jgi:hypothetical protein
MVKNFEIQDILSAVNSISKSERKKARIEDIENISNDKSDITTLNNQVKSSKTEILVLDQMIE